MNLEDRNRKHLENHIRTVEQQILDALLRIEELLAASAETSDVVRRADGTPMDVTDVVKNVKPIETPLLGKLRGKGRK